MATFWSFADNVYGDDRNLARYRSMDFFRFRRLFNRPAPDEMCWRVRKDLVRRAFLAMGAAKGSKTRGVAPSYRRSWRNTRRRDRHPSLLHSFGRAPGHLRLGPQRDHPRGHPLAIDRPLARVKEMVARLARGRTFPPAPGGSS